MSSSPLQIQCSNPTCLHPANPIGQHSCDRCQVPLVYRYLWALGENIDQISPNTVIDDRYLVKSPHVWLDTKPGFLPGVPDLLPDRALPYLHLFPHRLHVPELYGFCLYGQTPVMLLDNVPIDGTGQLLASLDSAWTTVSSVRQVYWLWQLLQLWQPLKEQGVARSLLVRDNIRVEGWRVRLQLLIPDQETRDQRDDVTEPGELEPLPTMPPGSSPPDAVPSHSPALNTQQMSLKDLADAWSAWIEQAHPSVRAALERIAQQMQTTKDTEPGLRTIATQLNRLLLEQVAQLPLQIESVGKTDTGPQRTHNEDACYPNVTDRSYLNDALHQYLGIICDGIGGHEGGEVASQRALNDLKRLVQNLINECQEQTEPTFPTEVEQQLQSIVRIVNNVISKQNDDQGRELRQRMGTTLVMAVQLPQRIETPTGSKNAHELYLVTVGDSRAYWLTPRYCHRLTVDDDVATREVRLGRSVYQEAVERPDGGALTQALGTRDADTLHPTVQRFVIEESGILLLCSDGLSDNDRVEQSWEPLTRAIFKGKLSLDKALQAWIDLANQQNGHDNTSVVIMRFQVGSTTTLPEPEHDVPESPLPPPATPAAASDLTEASRALLYDEASQVSEDSDEVKPTSAPDLQSNERSSIPWAWLAGAAIVAFAVGALGFFWYNSTLAPSQPDSQPTPAEEVNRLPQTNE